MTCKYGEVTKSGRIRCTYHEEGEEGKTSSPTFNNSDNNSKGSKKCVHIKNIVNLGYNGSFLL